MVWLPVAVGTSEEPLDPVAWAAALLATTEEDAAEGTDVWTEVWTAAEVEVGTEPE